MIYNVVSQWYFNAIGSEFFQVITIPAIVVAAVYLVYRLINGITER